MMLSSLMEKEKETSWKQLTEKEVNFVTYRIWSLLKSESQVITKNFSFSPQGPVIMPGRASCFVSVDVDKSLKIKTLW